MTMNDDTPQVFGDDTHDHPRDAYPHDPAPPSDQDGEDFPPFRGWPGWEERVEPVGPDDEYPQPSFSAYEPASYELEHPRRPAPGQPGYPPGPGYAPDSGYARDLGYPHDPEAAVRYLPDHGYTADHGYAADLGFAEDPGYAGNSGYAGNPDFGRDAEPVPAMEPLPDPAGQSAMPAPVLLPPRGAAEIAPPPPVGHHGFRDQVLAPPSVLEPEYQRETSDSLTTESLLHGKRAAPGSGWRRSVYRASGGLLRFGESSAEMRRRDLINRVRTPVAGGHQQCIVWNLGQAFACWLGSPGPGSSPSTRTGRPEATSAISGIRQCPRSSRNRRR